MGSVLRSGFGILYLVLAVTVLHKAADLIFRNLGDNERVAAEQDVDVV